MVDEEFNSRVWTPESTFLMKRPIVKIITAQ